MAACGQLKSESVKERASARLKSQQSSAEELARFRTESEAVAALNHPNVVRVYEVGEHEGQHYFSMKLIEGGNLADWLKKRFTGRRNE